MQLKNTIKTRSISFLVFMFSVLLLIVFSFKESKAQLHEFGIGLGIANYSGELNRFPHLYNSRPYGQVFYRYNATKSITLRINAGGGMLAGDEKYNTDTLHVVRGGSFLGNLFQGSLLLEYNFFNYRDKKTPVLFCPYGIAGISAFGYTSNLTANIDNELYTNSIINFAIPFGVGVKYALSPNINLNAEFIANKTFTDYIDGFSKGVINNRNTGDPNETDWFYTFSLNISYTIFKVNCPMPLN